MQPKGAMVSPHEVVRLAIVRASQARWPNNGSLFRRGGRCTVSAVD